MRITLQEMINRHKQSNPNTEYSYDKTVLGKTLHDKVVIICPIHGDFLQAPHEHMKGQGCPKCAIKYMSETKRGSVEEFIKKSKEKFNNKFSYELTKETYIKMKSPCTIHCNEHDINFEIWPARHLKNMHGGCPMCCKHKTLEREKAKEQRKQEREEKRLKREQEKRYRDEIKLEKQKERELKQLQKQKRKENKTKDLLKSFIDRATKKYGNKYDYSYIEEYVNSITKVPIYCHEKDEEGNEHGIFWKRPDGFMQGQECPKCKHKYECTTESILKYFNKIHNGIYSYPNFEYISMRSRTLIHCNKCGRDFEQVTKEHFRHGCPYCNISHFEEQIEKFLKENNIEFIPQCGKQVFEWLNLQTFDFYLPKYNIAIECQGGQHFEPSVKFGWRDGFKNTINRDKKKKQLCREHNVTLIYYLEKKFEKFIKEDDLYFTNTDDLLEFLAKFSSK